MIETLRISGLAIVHEAELEFAPGLNVITGETGAGKSIVLGALSLLAGGRAGGRGLSQEGDALVEAVFRTDCHPDFEALLDHIWFDTCVYHQPGIDLLVDVVPSSNILFASEMVGAVRGIDPETGNHFDDTKRYIEAASLSADDRAAIYDANVRRVYPRLELA